SYPQLPSGSDNTHPWNAGGRFPQPSIPSLPSENGSGKPLPHLHLSPSLAPDIYRETPYYLPPILTLHFIAGPPQLTGMLCFLPHLPPTAQYISLETRLTVFRTSKATPEIVVSLMALPNLPFLISYPKVTPNMNSLVESACPLLVSIR